MPICRLLPVCRLSVRCLVAVWQLPLNPALPFRLVLPFSLMLSVTSTLPVVFLLSVAALMVPRSATAADSLPFNLSDVVVTAGRIERPLADTPVRTQLLDRATIQKLHTRDLRDALRIMPGVQLREVHGKTGDQVYLQGFDGNRVLILVDGLPITATTGSTVDVSQVSTLDIDHIEIVPGSGSSQYGSAAMGGVINVITRKADSHQGGHIKFDSGTFGERELEQQYHPGQRHFSADVYSRVAGFNWTAALDVRQSDDFDLDKNSYPSNGYEGEKTNYSVSLARDFSASSYSLKARRFVEDSAYRTMANGGFNAQKFELLERNHLSSVNHWQLNDAHSVSATLLYEQQQDLSDQLKNDRQITLGNLYRDALTHQKKASLQWRWLPQQWGFGLASVVTGVDWYQEDLTQKKAEIKLSAQADSSVGSVESLDDGSYRHTTTEVPFEQRRAVEGFIQSTLPLSPRLELAPGIRWQTDSDFGYHSAPSINMRYGLNIHHYDVQLRTGVAAGYRVPNLKERFYVFDHSVNGYKVVGSDDLLPEQNRSTQASLTVTDNRTFNAELSLFHNRISDLIETRDTGERDNNGTVAIYQYSNYARAMTRGYDISLQHALLSGLQQRVSFSYLDARDLELGQALPNRSARNIKLLWLWDARYNWNITLTGEYQSEFYTDVSRNQKSPGYLRWDIKSDYRWNTKLSFYGGIDNINDAVRDPADENDRRPSRGRYSYVGVSYHF